MKYAHWFLILEAYTHFDRTDSTDKRYKLEIEFVDKKLVSSETFF